LRRGLQLKKQHSNAHITRLLRLLIDDGFAGWRSGTWFLQLGHDLQRKRANETSGGINMRAPTLVLSLRPTKSLSSLSLVIFLPAHHSSAASAGTHSWVMLSGSKLSSRIACTCSHERRRWLQQQKGKKN
jgi:hypothetical protein